MAIFSKVENALIYNQKFGQAIVKLGALLLFIG
jgi:hypothetical protein